MIARLMPWLVLALLSPLAGAQEPDAVHIERLTPLVGTRPAQWRVVWTTDPDTRATISWTTAEAGSSHRVHYWLDGTERETGATVSAQRNGEYTRSERDLDQVAPAHFHHARIDGLRPSTPYRFQIESDGEVGRELYFTTAPADDRSFALLVGGDSRSGHRARCFINDRIASLSAEDHSILALSHGGDFVMTGDRWADWSAWLSHHELTTGADGRVLPLLPTRGNHDFGPLFDQAFDDPGGAGRNYFRTELSSAVSLITLNSNISVAGDQLTWLEGALNAGARASRWLVTNYHRPLYPAVKSPGEAKPFWTPLFDRFGVDVALESDGHCIKRTMPIRGDAADPAGTVYIGEGGLGVPQRTPRTEPWYLQPPALSTNGHHVIRVDFGAETLRLRILRLGDLPSPQDPRYFEPLVAPGSHWRHRFGDDPPAGWNTVTFDDSGWDTGPAGFGYGDDDDATVLEAMRGEHRRLLTRVRFDTGPAGPPEEMALHCRFDDAFVAFLNGVEVARGGLRSETWADDQVDPENHEASTFERFDLSAATSLLTPEGNVLAVVGINRRIRDKDFTLDAWLSGPRVLDEGTLVPTIEVIDDDALPPRRR